MTTIEISVLGIFLILLSISFFRVPQDAIDDED
jgi:hypothetical protein